MLLKKILACAVFAAVVAFCNHTVGVGAPKLGTVRSYAYTAKHTKLDGKKAFISTVSPIVLADNGKTHYVIVKPDTGGVLDEIAARELSRYLGKATGAEFHLVTAEEAGTHSRRLVVGNGSFARMLFGAKTLDGLKNQESVVLTKGNDILLAGQGTHGTSQAVYSFLRNQVGCRWFTPYDDELTPVRKRLEVKQFSYHFIPSFAYRNHMLDYSYKHANSGLYFVRNGLNSTAAHFSKSLYPELAEYCNLKDFELLGPGCHTSFSYIPPDPEHVAVRWPWNKVQYYFESHPEYFSMDAKGVRVSTMQLCFSNPELRNELTGRLLENIGREGGKGYWNLSAMDCGGSFCHCPGCKALEAKYKSPGGPLYDYLIEACAAIKAKYPEAGLSTLAYRKSQSEKPPVINGKLPDNLAIIFAPIDDDFRKTFDTPENADTYTNLKNWCKVSDKIIVWYYPMIYNTCGLPSAFLDRIVTDTRLMKKAGVMGTFFEHDVTGVYYGGNFADLYTYVIDNIYSNVDTDVPGLINEFTDYYYGPAAPEARAYLNELERCRKTLHDRIPYDAGEGMLTYMTPEWLKAQQRRFDKMESLCRGDQRTLENVGILRFALDMACLGNKYQSIAAGNRANFPTVELISKRARANLESALATRFPKGEEKARAAELKGILPALEERTKIAQIPAKPGTIQIFAEKGTSVLDPDAALGWTRSSTTKLPFRVCLYDNTMQKKLANLKLTSAEIKPDRYNLYLIGTSTLTSDCYIDIDSKYYISCVEAYNGKNPMQTFDVYISLKFEGPSFGSSASEDKAFCDKFVLVKK